jgi:hypothetical protein
VSALIIFPQGKKSIKRMPFLSQKMLAVIVFLSERGHDAILETAVYSLVYSERPKSHLLTFSKNS